MNREIPIIADEMVDREFGTGVVKITPAHDPNDFEVGKRHKLAEIDVMTDDGKMSAAAGSYAGMDRFAARKRVVIFSSAPCFCNSSTTRFRAPNLSIPASAPPAALAFPPSVMQHISPRRSPLPAPMLVHF